MKDLIREVLSEELLAVNGNRHQEDRLLNAEEAAEVLGVSAGWLYHNARRLPFTRKIGAKFLRFSQQGIQRYIDIRKLR